MDYQQRMEHYRNAVEAYLTDSLPQRPLPYQRLVDAMRYSLLAGGKRLRPILTLEFCRLCGGEIEQALPIACGIEMLHTYSLIHDDLPCMDDDDLRRGKASNHKVFGEYTATLAGDALQTFAFETLLSAGLDAQRILRCAKILASGAGYYGICGGQQMDMEWEGRTLCEEEIMEIHRRKTGALISAACLMGVAAAGGNAAQEKAAQAYAQALGLAFQIRDDMLDVIGDEKVFGKPIGSDKQEGKTTFADLFGLSGCEERIAQLTKEAVAALSVFEDPSFLKTLAGELTVRKN